VNAWTISLLSFVIFAQIPLYALTVTNESDYYFNAIAMVWYAILAALSFSNVVVLFQIWRIQCLRSASKAVQQGIEADNKKLSYIMQRIQHACIASVILTMAICTLIHFMQPWFSRTPYSNPSCDVDLSYMALRMSCLVWILLFGTAVWFLLPIMLFKLRQRKECSRRARLNHIHTMSSSIRITHPVMFTTLVVQ
jgi:hypothetical protein